MPVSQALNILKLEAGKQFDPLCVDTFVRLVEMNKITVRL